MDLPVIKMIGIHVCSRNLPRQALRSLSREIAYRECLPFVLLQDQYAYDVRSILVELNLADHQRTEAHLQIQPKPPAFSSYKATRAETIPVEINVGPTPSATHDHQLQSEPYTTNMSPCLSMQPCPQKSKTHPPYTSAAAYLPPTGKRL